MSGYVKLHRSINDNPLWTSEPFTKAQAWIDLFLNANWKDGILDIRGNIIEIKRGQLGWSELTMCKRWKWSRTKVRRYLLYLEKTGNLIQQKTNLTTVITICNYDKYQSEDNNYDTTDDTTDDTTERQQKDNRRYTIEEGKEGKEGKEENHNHDDDKFFNMKELNALAVKYLGWSPVMPYGRVELLRRLLGIFKEDVQRGFEAASSAGATNVNYVITVAKGENKKQTKPSVDECRAFIEGN